MKAFAASMLVTLALAGALLWALGAFDGMAPARARRAVTAAPSTPAANATRPVFVGPSAPLVATEEPADKRPPATAGERARAIRVLDFYNTAAMALDGGWYNLPDLLRVFTRAYLAEWRLGRMPRMRGSRSEARGLLTPPESLFAAADREHLVQALKDMDAAADSMLADYRRLEDYVRDVEIQDDGKKGKSLGASLERDFGRFAAARGEYLSLLEERASAAEDLLLAGHPLRRQILLARRIFALYRDVTDRLALARPERGQLAALRDSLSGALAEAGLPPFRGKPDLERLYRAFLKEVEQYLAALGRGVDEGFYTPFLRGLNQAQQASREAYNAFVAAVNLF